MTAMINEIAVTYKGRPSQPAGKFDLADLMAILLGCHEFVTEPLNTMDEKSLMCI